MRTKEMSSIDDDPPAGSVATTLLSRLRTAAMPPKPFTEADTEKRFMSNYQENGMLAYSIALLIGGIALFGFFVAHAIEGAAYGSNRWIPQTTRLTISISLVGLAYLMLSRRAWFYSHFNSVGLIGPVVAIAGVALLPFTMYDNAANPGFPFARFFLSLATTIWICFAFSRISRLIMISTSAVASLALVSFAIHHDFSGAYFSSMHLIIAIWAGWALSVLIEKRERQGFMSRERMSIESRALAENIERTDLINEMQAEALQTIAHDIRQPLLSLGLYADVMTSKYKDIPNIDDLAAKMKFCLAASENSIAIVENVLHSANIASRLNSTQITLTNPLTMLDVVFSPILSSTGIRLKLPPPSQQQISVWTNEHALNEILSNLVSNANKHAWFGITPRSKRILVTIEEVDHRFIEIVVADNGKGINPDDLDRVFEKGFRSNNQSSRPSGDGLGLSIVRGLINKLSDHEVSIQSTQSVGTTFRVRIPRFDPDSLRN